MSTPQLDWTFGPAPAAEDEPPPNTAPRRPRPNPRAALRLSPRTWLLLGVVTVLALGLTVALPLMQNARSRQAVEQVVAKQEAARLAGDWDALSATYATDSIGWSVTRVLRLRHGWLPTPISLPGLRSDGRPGRVSRFQVVGPQLARADVERGFVLADGLHVEFAMPQFYQFAGGAWRQAPPPDEPSDQAQHIHGPRVDVTYFPDDGDLASVVAGDLGDLLVRACVDWNCPPELHVAVIFNSRDPASAASPAAFDTLMGSLTLQIILGRPSAYPTNEVNLASRLAGGYPADAAASEAVRRAAGVQALLLVAQQLAPNALLHGENAYLDAMIAREASRLGIDAPGLRQMQIANPLFGPEDLWSVPLLHFASDGALPEALVIINAVLADRDLADEQRLMHAFTTAQDAKSWLAAGTGLDRGEVYRRMNWALDPRLPTVQWPSFEPDLALSCPPGPVLASLSGQTAPLFAGDYPDSPVDAWSPDGKRIALSVFGRRGIIAVDTQLGLLGQFLPLPTFQTGFPVSWASNTVLVYPPVHVYLLSDSLQIENLGLDFFDSFDRTATRLSNFDTYLPSPDGAWAAVVGQPYGSGSTLSIIPALGGQPVITATSGYNPAWSADSRHLAFALRDSELSSLVVYDMATRDKHKVFLGSAPGVPAAVAPTSLMPAWSPAGDELAVASVSNSTSEFVGWVGLIRPDGTGFKLLPAAQKNVAPNAVAYSSDGRYLAVDLFASSGARGVALYSLDGALLRWLPGFGLIAWSPTGHILALTSLDGVTLLREPDATPQAIGPAGCTGLVWRP